MSRTYVNLTPTTLVVDTKGPDGLVTVEPFRQPKSLVKVPGFGDVIQPIEQDVCEQSLENLKRDLLQMDSALNNVREQTTFILPLELMRLLDKTIAGGPSGDRNFPFAKRLAASSVCVSLDNIPDRPLVPADFRVSAHYNMLCEERGASLSAALDRAIIRVLSRTTLSMPYNLDVTTTEDHIEVSVSGPPVPIKLKLSSAAGENPLKAELLVSEGHPGIPPGQYSVTEAELGPKGLAFMFAVLGENTEDVFARSKFVTGQLKILEKSSTTIDIVYGNGMALSGVGITAKKLAKETSLSLMGAPYVMGRPPHVIGILSVADPANSGETTQVPLAKSEVEKILETHPDLKLHFKDFIQPKRYVVTETEVGSRRYAAMSGRETIQRPLPKSEVERTL